MHKDSKHTDLDKPTFYARSQCRHKSALFELTYRGVRNTQEVKTSRERAATLPYTYNILFS